jgi:serine/threonine protein kinase
MLAQAKPAPHRRSVPPPVVSDHSPLGTILDGRYRVLALLDQGSMGSVYLGERMGIGRRVALKFLRKDLALEPGFVTRFGIEAQALGRLSHPHCVSVIDFGGRAAPYLVMDLVEGESLRDVLAEGPVPIARAVGIARQLLAGLAHAHSRAIVHRDVKPENVVLESAAGIRGDHVRILDFGLARLQDHCSIINRGMILGTPCYLAPEQLQGDEIDERADIYAVGVVLYEMLSGRPPFETASVAETLLAQSQTPPPALASIAPDLAIPAPLEQVIRRALHKAPADRFGSALEMIDALDRATGADPADDDQAVWLDAVPDPEPLAIRVRVGTRALVHRTRTLINRTRTRLMPAWQRAAAAAGRLRDHARRGLGTGAARWRGLPQRTRQLTGAALAAFAVAFLVVSLLV